MVDREWNSDGELDATPHVARTPVAYLAWSQNRHLPTTWVQLSSRCEVLLGF